MNMPVHAPAPQLPAHLMNFGSASNLGLNVVGGINIGKAHPRVSIKQNRFRLIDEQGQEFVVPQLYLDVIIVGANPVVSKMYYAGAYNPQAAEAEAPTCWSDNGTAPSSRASTPQSGTCEACPHNVWGSKVTPAGSKIKACADSKKMAVILVDNPTGPVYELRVPGASLENIKAIAESMSAKGVPLPGLIIRLTFDETAGYPKLLFTAVNYISADQKAAVMDVIDGEEVKEAVGMGDVPRTAGAALAPPVVQQPVPQVFAPTPMQPPVAPPVMPTFQPAQQAAMPQPPQFAPPPPVPAFMNAVPAETVLPKPRKRRAQAEPVPPPMGAAVPQQSFAPQAPQFQAAPPALPMPQTQAGGFEIPAFLRRQDIPHAAPAAQSVPIQPQQTDAALDALLKDAMS